MKCLVEPENGTFDIDGHAFPLMVYYSEMVHGLHMTILSRSEVVSESRLQGEADTSSPEKQLGQREMSVLGTESGSLLVQI